MNTAIRHERPRTLLVTGASAGFGHAIAQRFLRAGNRVVALARRAERLEALAVKFGRDHIHVIAADVADRSAIDQAIAAIPAPFREIDVLVNNAGLALGLEPAPRANLEDWERMIDTNCKGVTYMTRAVLPQMVSRGSGHVINIGSVAGTYPYPGGNVYGATKAFVHQFSLNLRSDLHGTGVRVSCLEPGMCGGTEFSEVRFGGSQERAAAVYAGMQPLTADDIAASVEWIATLPPHVNVNTLELMPVAQSFAPFQVYRQA
jgi:3-hydroxy acid dehydrogenase / malonic semialdehyde reductase